MGAREGQRETVGRMAELQLEAQNRNPGVHESAFDLIGVQALRGLKLTIRGSLLPFTLGGLHLCGPSVC